MEKSEQINEVFSALSKAQAQLKHAHLDCYNSFTKHKYASLSAIQESYRDALAKNDLVLTQLVEHEDNTYTILTMIGHSSGQWFSSKQKLMLNKEDMQGLGAAITYARRQSICAMLGIVDAEDDKGLGAAVDTVKNDKTAYSNGVAEEFAKKWDATKDKRKLEHKLEKKSPDETTKKVDELIADGSLPDPKSDAAEIFNAKDYKIEFGKHTGKTLGALGVNEVRSYLDWVEKNTKQPVGKKVKLFIDYGKMYLNSVNGV